MTCSAGHKRHNEPLFVLCLVVPGCASDGSQVCRWRGWSVWLPDCLDWPLIRHLGFLMKEIIFAGIEVGDEEDE
jgi:hypothetical protein